MTRPAQHLLCLLAGAFVLAASGDATALDRPHFPAWGMNCRDCHALHAGQEGLLPRGADQEVVCKSCHNPTGIAQHISDVAMHVVDAGARVVDCGSCHDPQGSWTETNPSGNPYMIRDVVDGTTLVDDGVRPGSQWTGPPWDTFGVSQDVVVAVNQAANPPTVDWGGSSGLCGACHSNWQGGYSWHAYCTGCQTCHGHGQDWANADWGGGEDDATSCATCGNGVMEGFEQCDDGNTDSGDGCSNECTIEP